MEDLLRTGTVDPENVERAQGLADWEPLPAAPGGPRLSDVLAELRAEEDQ